LAPDSEVVVVEYVGVSVGKSCGTVSKEVIFGDSNSELEDSESKVFDPVSAAEKITPGVNVAGIAGIVPALETAGFSEELCSVGSPDLSLLSVAMA
jgi:hypothetical protein